MIDIIKKEKCTGCKMCADVCSKNAISYQNDEQGFWYPVVDYDKCVKCGLCKKKCPSFKEKLISNEKPTIYSAWSIDDDVRLSSTSGGVFFEFAKYYLENDGVVFGCKYEEGWKSAKHIIIDNVQDLDLIKGSKYFQSDTSGIYNEVKKHLDKGKKVLFCGTPCQCYALKSFLDKDYSNLLVMDFICRSINSPKAFKTYLDEIEKVHNSKVKFVQLKNKTRGWQSLATKVVLENDTELIRDKNEDWWVKGFIIYDLYTRKSCYSCQYRNIPRVTSDISIGDFWGIKNENTENMFKGISAVILNTSKGNEWFEKVKSKMVVKKHNLEEVIDGNPALINNPIYTKRQDKFFKLINKKGKTFSEAVKICTKKTVIQRGISIMKSVLRKIRRLCVVMYEGKVSIPLYIYYNYLTNKIVRKNGARVMPYKGAVLDIAKDAKIYLNGGLLQIGFNKLKKSKSETHIRLEKGAVWNCNNGAMLFFNTTVDLKPYAKLDTGFFSANEGCCIVIDKHIVLGEDVMLGRNVILYDSDFHQIVDDEGEVINKPKKVVVEDHVWLTSNITVLKGVTIGRDSLVTAQTVVNKDVPEDVIYAGGSTGKVIKEHINWLRKRIDPTLYEDL